MENSLSEDILSPESVSFIEHRQKESLSPVQQEADRLFKKERMAVFPDLYRAHPQRIDGDRFVYGEWRPVNEWLSKKDNGKLREVLEHEQKLKQQDKNVPSDKNVVPKEITDNPDVLYYNFNGLVALPFSYNLGEIQQKGVKEKVQILLVGKNHRFWIEGNDSLVFRRKDSDSMGFLYHSPNLICSLGVRDEEGAMENLGIEYRTDAPHLGHIHQDEEGKEVIPVYYHHLHTGLFPQSEPAPYMKDIDANQTIDISPLRIRELHAMKFITHFVRSGHMKFLDQHLTTIADISAASELQVPGLEAFYGKSAAEIGRVVYNELNNGDGQKYLQSIQN